jgi:hypothetical protein
METSVTLVSCLFWLARTKWQHSGFPPNYDRYSSWSENFLSLDANIVIFTDDHYYEVVKERRLKYDPDLSKTKIIVKKVVELDFYKKYFFKMSVLMASPAFKKIKHGDCADNMYPLYNVVQYNKISLIKEVRDANPFNSTHFMWMDCGSCRENLEKYRNNKFPVNSDLINDKVIHFTHNLEFQIGEVKQHYFLSQIRNIQGTAWMMPAQHVDKYYDLISNELETTMNDGFIGSDEKTYDSIYQTNKDIVHLVKCGWFQFFDVMRAGPQCNDTQEEEVYSPWLETPVVDTCQQQPQEQACQQQEEVVNCSESVTTNVENTCETQEETVACSESVATNVETACEAPPEQNQQCCSDFCATQVMAMQANTATLEVKKSWWRRMVGI